MMNEITAALDRCIAEKGMSRNDFYARSGINHSTLSKSRTRNGISIRTLKRACSALEMKVWELLKRVDY